MARDLINAIDDAGLRPRHITDHLWMCVCPACWGYTPGGRHLMIIGDEWPDILCANATCPTNSAEARADTRDQIRVELRGTRSVDATSAWSHLARRLGMDVLARIILTSRPARNPLKSSATRATTTGVPRAHVPRSTIPTGAAA